MGEVCIILVVCFFAYCIYTMLMRKKDNMSWYDSENHLY